MLDRDVPWRVHFGDLHLAGSLRNGHPLVVVGDLRIDGDYDDHGLRGPNGRIWQGFLVVTGNLSVGNLASRGVVHVEGDLDARGLALFGASDWSCVVHGCLRGRGAVLYRSVEGLGALVAGFCLGTVTSVTSGGTSSEGKSAEAAHEAPGDPARAASVALRRLHAELFRPSLRWPGPPELRVSLIEVQRHLARGAALFRDPPLDRAFLENLVDALDPKTPLEDLALDDVLVQRIVVMVRDDLPPQIVADMVRSGDRFTLLQLSLNPRVPGPLRLDARRALVATA